MKPTFKNITIDQFKKLISTMNNENFCFFINHLMEVNFTDMVLLPIFKSKYGDYQWISYYCEDGKPYNETCYKIVNEIEKYKDDFDFVLVNPDNKCIFFNGITFKNDIFNMLIFEKLYSNKEMWADEHYSNGNFCDGYDYLLNNSDMSVLF